MNDNRRNQDRYDVLQAQEEWASMHLPRNIQKLLAELRARIVGLEQEVAALRLENDELKDYKFRYEGLQ